MRIFFFARHCGMFVGVRLVGVEVSTEVQMQVCLRMLRIERGSTFVVECMGGWAAISIYEFYQSMIADSRHVFFLFKKLQHFFHMRSIFREHVILPPSKKNYVLQVIILLEPEKNFLANVCNTSSFFKVISVRFHFLE